MRKALISILLVISFCLLHAGIFAQPIELLTQQTDDEEVVALTTELRSIHNLERDIAIEKLTRAPTRLEAYLELGQLRLTQGKLQEAQRFFEMALEISPRNQIAIQGMVMVHYHKGEFNLAKQRIDSIHKIYPLSDQLREELEIYKMGLENKMRLGVAIREDDTGLKDIISSIEAVYPGNSQFKKLTGAYRLEYCTNEDKGERIKSRRLLASFDYKADKNTLLTLAYAPETFSDNSVIDGYNAQLISGTNNLKLALKAGKCGMRDNLYTIKNRFFEKQKGFCLFGDLHKRTRAIQTVTLSELSDGNSKRRFDSELIHCVFRDYAPFLTANLRFYQISYERQTDSAGNELGYWAPSDFYGAELRLSYEKSFRANWWWGIDASLTGNDYSLNGQDGKESGVGGALHLNYRFSEGDLFFSIGDNIYNYYRERRLEFCGSFSF